MKHKSGWQFLNSFPACFMNVSSMFHCFILCMMNKGDSFLIASKAPSQDTSDQKFVSQLVTVGVGHKRYDILYIDVEKLSLPAWIRICPPKIYIGLNSDKT